MELIPQEIRKSIPTLYATEDMDESDILVYVKLFINGWSWFITELSINNDLAFGYVVSPFCDGELGYISIEEIQTIKGSLGIGVERDISFKPTLLSIIKA